MIENLILRLKKTHIFIISFIILLGCAKKYDYTYELQTEFLGKKLDAKVWILNGEKLPPINLYDQTAFVNDVNTVLQKLNLPKVTHAVVEKSSITKFRTDRGEYEWTDYPLGTLQIMRHTDESFFRGKYDCIWKIIILE